MVAKGSFLLVALLLVAISLDTSMINYISFEISSEIKVTEANIVIIDKTIVYISDDGIISHLRGKRKSLELRLEELKERKKFYEQKYKLGYSDYQFSSE